MSRRRDRGRPGKSALRVGTATKPIDTTTVPRAIVKGVKSAVGESIIVAGRVRSRRVVLVHCPACSAVHLHAAALDTVELARKAPCGSRYVVRVTPLAAGRTILGRAS